ncbi:MAG: glycosyltransferase [Candidatus Solibacter usitatus]|nr:glycosyltransferase [Candidatus Solibacter usitatus]
MRVAFFSPLPPSRSGIADYSAALVEELRKLATVEVFADAGKSFQPSSFDLPVYQIGNNAFHAHAYEMALKHPGIAVLHEANLHHLICDLTIRRDDWDGYVTEAAYNGGDTALAYAERVRALETGPDYEGLPMLRRLLERSRGLIVHSQFVASEARRAGFDKPIAVIPHGSWLPETSGRLEYRHKLGLDEAVPLIGIFGFLKPYKRIAESLRAFARLVRVVPEAKLILVGEEHPDFPLRRLITSLGLDAAVRVVGFTPLEEFNGYLSACDVVLNLRYPTVGETSGTLLRALGLGKAVIVSEVGAFAEFPDDVVCKVPVDSREEDALFEYLNTLVSRPHVARAIGGHARQWVERECAWPLAASRYLEFMQCVLEGREYVAQPVAPQAPKNDTPSAPVEAFLQTWSPTPAAVEYLDIHLTRLQRTLDLTPRGGDGDRVLEMGAYMQITPALRTKLGYGEVRGCYLGPLGRTDHKRAVSSEGEEFACEIDLFNAEKDIFPYADESFATVLCCELIEHLESDPMFMMAEINRILRPGGHLLLTTPNIGSLKAIRGILQGYHPGFFPAYLKPGPTDDARHNREYTPKEIVLLFLDAGFEITHLETGPFRELARPEDQWVEHLLERYLCPTDLRGDGIYAVGRKIGPVKQRYPSWLYS